MNLRETIEQAWTNREMMSYQAFQDGVRKVIEEVDKGRLRVADPTEGGWQVNEWVKQAILLYFSIQPMQTWNVEPFEFYDKMLLKKNYKEAVETIRLGKLSCEPCTKNICIQFGTPQCLELLETGKILSAMKQKSPQL